MNPPSQEALAIISLASTLFVQPLLKEAGADEIPEAHLRAFVRNALRATKLMLEAPVSAE